jgi:hypothetical protein
MRSADVDLDELGVLWRRQPVSPQGPSPGEILARARQKGLRLERAIFWRNVREIAAGALGAGAMAWTSWLAPGWLPKVAAAAALASVVLVTARLLRARRAHPPVRPDLPLVEWLAAERRLVEAEIELLRSVVSWYVVPLAVGASLWCVTIVTLGLSTVHLSPTRLLLATALSLAFCALLFTLVGWGVRWVNRLGVDTYLAPYAEELRQLGEGLQARDEELSS